jgi:hypothetical protein
MDTITTRVLNETIEDPEKATSGLQHELGILIRDLLEEPGQALDGGGDTAGTGIVSAGVEQDVLDKGLVNVETDGEALETNGPTRKLLHGSLLV